MIEGTLDSFIVQKLLLLLLLLLIAANGKPASNLHNP